jgi:uncharacterized protein (DUF697 family)/tellurite resistance protein
MNETEQRAILTVALMAALADGATDERERALFRALAQKLSGESIDTGTIYEQVLRDRPALADAVKPLATAESRAIAFDAAVGIAHADGATSPQEATFLQELADALALPAPAAQATVATANAIATVPMVDSRGPTPVRSAPDPATLDAMILNAAITNAALELLPESLASMAIIPLQMKLVYRIGQAYGFELDAGHVKDFLATLGVGLTAQYLEQFGRKLLGGLLGSIAGGIGRAVGHQAASSGMAFASTWALGQVARQYYAGGRVLDADKLRAAFGPLLEHAGELGTRYAGEIRQRAQSIDLSNLPALIAKA